MKDVIFYDKGVLLAGEALPGFVYAAIDKDKRDDLIVVHQLDDAKYAVASVVTGNNVDDYDELGKRTLEGMLSALIDMGYKVLQFEDIGEFGSWITGQKWKRPEITPAVMTQKKEPDMSIPNALVTPTKRHALAKIEIYPNNLWIKTLCGIQVSCDRYGTRCDGHEGWYLTRFYNWAGQCPPKCRSCAF